MRNDELPTGGLRSTGRDRRRRFPGFILHHSSFIFPFAGVLISYASPR